MNIEELRKNISLYIGVLDVPEKVTFREINRKEYNEYTQIKIEYDSNENDVIPAYLLIPNQSGKHPAVIIHHQHNSERHLGKSEVCGIDGNPLQAFGPALAKLGFVVLSPDSICFEERRPNANGTKPLPNDGDFYNHLNEMCYRLLRGENLMRKVLFDAMLGVSLLRGLDVVDSNRIGAFGHSYGGNTVMFHSALDTRVSFSCASGSACTYKNRESHSVGIEMASVIPGFTKNYDIDTVISCIAPRKLFIVSAQDDKYSRDAEFIVEKVSAVYEKLNCKQSLHHIHYNGGHGMTEERFHDILAWFKTEVHV